MKADPSDHVLPCNRAMARLKLKQWKLAEQDSTRSLDLLPSPNCKAHFRRGLARKGLKLWAESIEDLETALKIEPSNTSITTELKLVKLQLKADITNVSSLRTVAVSNQSEASSTPSKTSATSSAITSPASSQDSSSSSAASQLLENLSGSTSEATVTRDTRDSLIREVSTRRFEHTSRSLETTAKPEPPSNAFSALKDLRKKKEEGVYSSASREATSQHLGTSTLPARKAVDTEEILSATKNGVESSKATVSSVPNSSPRSFAELERRWGMSKLPETHWSVLKDIDPQILPTIFGVHLEPNFLDEIIEALKVSQRLGDKEEVAKAARLIEGLDGVSRLKTLTMFLEPDQKQVVRNVLVSHENSCLDYRRPPLTNWEL
ncbi:hypothetical protein CROQUDRAFT_667845 [Cronartium quercuum f. sp. fusiforme G11]|uniref:RNA polymerase II-associated protein 3 n=1 Tax=Cronartium quercuum f. sp. fusiforme G11 TaxID=708437 RepID=A0A9P6NXZ0_9BASI|nr:hypothetical protein CROQUDRAFT_667845 [Cronartium quercuum f. sp. fusiforme G11]